MTFPLPAPGEIVVAAVRLDAPPAEVARLAATLSARERARAGALLPPAERRRAVVARGRLREILGRATGRHPAAVDLRVTALGKPHLHDGSLQFSVAHCGDDALVALSTDRAVGVDLERHRPVPHLLDVARRVLAPQAVAELAALPDDRRTGPFFAWWTRTEAYLKARGEGLGGPAGLAFAPPSRSSEVPRAVAGRPQGRTWSVVDLAAPPGWSAAAAAPGTDWRATSVTATDAITG